MVARKFSDSDARAAYEMCDKGQSVHMVARHFGVASTTIQRLREGMTYKHLALTPNNTVILWGDPPPIKKNLLPQTRLRRTVALLRENPNRWANVYSTPGLNRENQRPAVDHWEAAGLETTVSWAEGTWTVHARWPETQFVELAIA